MLRRYLSTVRVGADLFPTAQTALASVDPWCLPQGQYKSVQVSASPASSQLASIVLKKDFQAGWYLFTQSRHPFNTELLGKLLAILPSGNESAHVWWPRAQQIKQVLDARNIRLSSAEYAVLINLASKAGNLAGVESLWMEMAEFGILRDTNVWNQYIMALCDANPQFWPWPRSRSTSFARYKSSHEDVRINTPPVTNLLERMELEGVPRNSRTYELVILALARQSADNLSACAQLAERLWTKETMPGMSGLSAIIDAFAFHSRLLEGYAIVRRIAASGLDSHAAEKFWTRLLRLIVAQTEPRGNVPTIFFDDVWYDMTSAYGYKPSLGAYSIRTEFLEMKNQFERMFDSVAEVVTVPGGVQLAQSIVTRAAVGLINTGRALAAAEHLQEMRNLGIEPTRDLNVLLAEHGASFEQLKLYEEDDDEDGVVGSTIL